MHLISSAFNVKDIVMYDLNSIIVKQHGSPIDQTKIKGKRGDRWYSSKGGFFCVPRPLRDDTRLSSLEFRVLIVIASHVFTSDTVSMSLETISKLSGHSVSEISNATSKLQNFGWLKEQARFNDTNIYTLTLPNEHRK